MIAPVTSSSKMPDTPSHVEMGAWSWYAVVTSPGNRSRWGSIPNFTRSLLSIRGSAPRNALSGSGRATVVIRLGRSVP